MRRCRYAAEVWLTPRGDDGAALPRRRFLLRCTRLALLAGLHLHDAPAPPWLHAAANVRVRWRSSGARDFAVDCPRGPAEVIE